MEEVTLEVEEVALEAEEVTLEVRPDASATASPDTDLMAVSTMREGRPEAESRNGGPDSDAAAAKSGLDFDPLLAGLSRLTEAGRDGLEAVTRPG